MTKLSLSLVALLMLSAPAYLAPTFAAHAAPVCNTDHQCNPNDPGDPKDPGGPGDGGPGDGGPGDGGPGDGGPGDGGPGDGGPGDGGPGDGGPGDGGPGDGGPPPPPDNDKPFDPHLPPDPHDVADNTPLMLIACRIATDPSDDLRFRNIGDLVIPAGTRVEWMVKESGDHGVFLLPSDLPPGKELSAIDVLKLALPKSDHCYSKVE